MPLRDTAPLGSPTWIELGSSDTAKSMDFYSQLFGWTTVVLGEEYGGYINFFHNDVLVAGMMASQGQPDGWATYLASEDAAATVAAATAQGAQVIVEPMDVMSLGVMAFVTHPAGGVVGIWQAGENHGFGVLAETGAPGWHELHTSDYAGALDFYAKVFGWKTEVLSDSDEFRYSVQVDDTGEQLAGIMQDSKLPAGVANWEVYFVVDNTDESVAKAVELGAVVVDPAVDSPYGRMAMLSDPTGALFNVIQNQG